MSWPSVSRSWTERLQFCPCDSSCRFGREFCVSGDRAPHSGMHQTQRFFAIVNPAAGGGRSAKLAGPALARLRQSNLQVDSVASTCPGHAVELAREASAQAILENRKRVIDLIRLNHATGEVFSFNLLSVGFTADVAALTNRAFKAFGPLGYLLGVFVRVVQLHRRSFALRCDEDQEWDERCS